MPYEAWAWEAGEGLTCLKHNPCETAPTCREDRSQAFQRLLPGVKNPGPGPLGCENLMEMISKSPNLHLW